MKCLRILITYLLCAQIQLFAQFNWVTQYPGTVSYFKDVFFLNENEGWVVGTSGSVYHTVDGGNTWIQQSAPTTQSLNGVWFVNNLSGWIVGDNELLLKTIDGGVTWTLASPPSGSSSHLYEINFIDENNGWICGFWDNFRTTDGGNTWTVFTASAGTSFEVSFLNPNDGWLVGVTGYVGYSHDGGQTWTAVSFPNADPSSIWATSFDNVFVGCDDGSIYKTTDGGLSWSLKYSGSGAFLSDISFYGSEVGIAVGENGLTLITLDAGETWNMNISGMTTSCYSTQMVSKTVSYTCGIGSYLAKSIGQENDLVIYQYLGLDTLCSGVLAPVWLNIYNYGPGPIEEADIILYDGSTQIMNIHWTGWLIAGNSEDVYLGDVELTNDGYYTGVISGDSINSNNTSSKYIEVVSPGITSNSPASICLGDSLGIYFEGAKYYYWFNASVDSTNNWQLVKPFNPINYYYAELITDYCTYVDSIVVLAQNCNITPSAISPNGDGVNDFLELNIGNSTSNVFILYGRWGDELFRINDYDNVSNTWSGQATNGENLVEGTYYYIFESSDATVTRAGWVQIVR